MKNLAPNLKPKNLANSTRDSVPQLALDRCKPTGDCDIVWKGLESTQLTHRKSTVLATTNDKDPFPDLRDPIIGCVQDLERERVFDMPLPIDLIESLSKESHSLVFALIGQAVYILENKRARESLLDHPHVLSE